MQTKKRAKPVKFGKQTKKEEPVSEAVEKKSKQIEEPEELEMKQKDKEEKAATKEQEEESVDEEIETEEITEEKEPEEEKEEKVEEDIEDPSQPSPFGSFINEAEEKKAKKGLLGFFFLVAFLTFLIGLAFIAALSYGIPYLQKGSLDLSIIQKETPTPTEAPPATPTLEAVDLSAYSVTLLNGSGLTGEAAKVKTALVDAGFKVGTVGNADTSDYTKTVIAAKKDVSEQYVNELTKTLKKTYSVNAVVEDLPISEKGDVVVTIGSSPAE